MPKTITLTCASCPQPEPVTMSDYGWYRHDNHDIGPCGYRLMDTAMRSDGYETDYYVECETCGSADVEPTNPADFGDPWRCLKCHSEEGT